MPARAPLALLCLTLLAGCASPPSPVDMTPRFVPGASRTEGVQAFLVLSTKIKDFRGAVGLTWKARVRSAGPEGARIEATIRSAYFDLPGGMSFSTSSMLGGLLKPITRPVLAKIFEKLVGLRFGYVVGPQGQVTLGDWESTLGEAARRAGTALPRDGSVFLQRELEGAISRAYGAVPYGVVELGGGKRRAVDYTIDGDDGAHVTGEDQLVYRGFAEFEVEQDDDELEVYGLDLNMSGPARVAAGRTTYGVVQTAPTQRQGQLVMSTSGTSLLYYREQVLTDIRPHTNVEFLNGIRVATYAKGWLFYAVTDWR